LRDPWVSLSSELANTGTYHAFSGAAHSPRIDFVLCNGHCEPLAVDIDRRSTGRVYPSDHDPVLATLRLRRVH
jgi:endonuclease/exonuclease/phosphatase family metal-dependent hydrolase